MKRIGHIEISASSVWRQAQKWGEVFGEVEEAERVLANAVPGQRDMLRLASRSEERMSVSMDGSMVHIRGEGWKELKVGCISEIEVRPTRDAEAGDVEDLAHAVRNSYRAHLGGPEIFGQLMWAEARRRNWEGALDTQAVGDGAPWIWNLVQEHFYDSQQVIDWYHAVEHLGETASLLKGEGTLAAQKWFNARETQLYQGHAQAIAQELSQAVKNGHPAAEELEKQGGYFHKNHRRMNYQELREAGWLIGSGMVESGAKQFKARFAGPGMRWSRSGAQKLLPIRTAIMSKRFDDCWHSAYKNSPQN